MPSYVRTPHRSPRPEFDGFDASVVNPPIIHDDMNFSEMCDTFISFCKLPYSAANNIYNVTACPAESGRGRYSELTCWHDVRALFRFLLVSEHIEAPQTLSSLKLVPAVSHLGVQLAERSESSLRTYLVPALFTVHDSVC